MVNYANRIVDVLGSGEIGLSPALDRFYTAARALAADPASPVARTGLLREAEGVSSRFRDLSSQLQMVEAETRQFMQSDLAEVNTLASQLAKVNLELSRNRSLERQPSALLDQRDVLLRKLADRVDIQVIESENGVVAVSIGGAGSSGELVAGQVARPLEARFDPQSPDRLTVLLDPWGRQPVSIAGVTGGSFGGVSAVRSMVLEPSLSNLDLLAKDFMAAVNALHTQGVDGYGQIGQSMFEVETSFNFERSRGSSALGLQASISNIETYIGKDIKLAFDADAGEVYSVALLEPFEQGDRLEVTLNGLSKSFLIGTDTSLPAVAGQLRQFIDGAFGIQLRTSVDPNGQVIVNSSVMKNFSFDVKLSSDQARVQLGQSQGLWVATDSEGRRIVGSTSLEVDGVTINLQGAPVNGEQVTVRASSRPAAGLRSVIDDPMKVAAAASFRVVRDNDNISTVRATVTDQIGSSLSANAAPVLGSPEGLPANSVASEARDWVAQRVVPFATVAAGQRDVVIYLDPGQTQANLQVLTRDGRHLLGTPQADGASFVSNATSTPAPFNSGSTYSAAYLNGVGSDAYRALSLFYGARALPRTREVMGTDHVPLNREVLPARLQADLELRTGVLNVPEGGLLINGVGLPSLIEDIGTVQDVADLLNAALEAARATGSDEDRQALFGITAEVVDDRLELTRPADAGTDDQLGRIEVSMGPGGSSDLMAKLGFRIAAYMDGPMPEDLLIFTTGSGDVKIAAEFAGQPMDASQRRSILRDSTFEFEFTAADRYRVIDIATGTVLAERDYAPEDSIDYQGLRVIFSAPPRLGDRFQIDGNDDGRGDNATALALVELERRGTSGPGRSLTLSESYLNVVDQVSNLTRQSQVAATALEVVHQQAVEARESVSGVSLDEEAANLIRFQQAYQAAAKSMQVASQMFDAVLRI
jgi:flagellar hook-associated protein FlgK